LNGLGDGDCASKKLVARLPCRYGEGEAYGGVKKPCPWVMVVRRTCRAHANRVQPASISGHGYATGGRELGERGRCCRTEYSEGYSIARGVCKHNDFPVFVCSCVRVFVCSWFHVFAAW
jgi:hypothetical protein